MAMKAALTRLTAIAALGLLAACAASGPTLTEKSATLPVLDQKARLFILRDTVSSGLGSDVHRPEILLNEKPIGAIVAGGVMVRDVPAGDYRLEVAPSAAGRALSGYTATGNQVFKLAPGEEKYVRVLVIRIEQSCLQCTPISHFAARVLEPSAGREAAGRKVLLSVASD